ncbi:MAG: hypothetical protein AAFO29_07595 [Actinomycetota bacterium]
MGAPHRRPPTPVIGQSVVIVAACMALVALTSTSRAAFVATTATTGNSASATDCFYSPTVQSGTASNTSNGTQTITISSVDPAKAFLIFQTRHDLNRPVGSILGGEIASATTIEFTRNTNESPVSSIGIQWYVIDYSCGVSVQRGTVAQTSSSVDVAITPVAALDQAFATFSKTVGANETQWGHNDQTIVDLTSASNLQIRTDTSNSAHTIYWQVVEFTDPAMISVQRGTTAIPTGSLTASVTLPTAVDTSRAFPLVSGLSDQQYLDELLLRTRLLSPTSLEIARGSSTDDMDEISWQVVELLDGTSVQHVHTLLDPGDASSTVTISAIDVTRATAFAGTQIGGGQNTGRTTYFADDILGVAAATFGVASSTEVTVTRTNTADYGSFGWQVVEWGN